MFKNNYVGVFQFVSSSVSNEDKLSLHSHCVLTGCYFFFLGYRNDIILFFQFYCRQFPKSPAGQLDCNDFYLQIVFFFCVM